MAFFRRKRGRVDLGTFEPPPFVEPPPVARVVEDAMLIARTAVRMAVKNRILVDAIRDDRDYDPAAMAELAREELVTLAAQNDAVAEHQLLERNIEVYGGLASALREAASDTENVAAIVEESRDAAWREISTVLRSRLSAMDPGRDPHYEAERESRLRALVRVDLAQLRLNRLPEY